MFNWLKRLFGIEPKQIAAGTDDELDELRAALYHECIIGIVKAKSLMPREDWKDKKLQGELYKKWIKVLEAVVKNIRKIRNAGTGIIPKLDTQIKYALESLERYAELAEVWQSGKVPRGNDQKALPSREIRKNIGNHYLSIAAIVADVDKKTLRALGNNAAKKVDIPWTLHSETVSIPRDWHTIQEYKRKQ